MAKQVNKPQGCPTSIKIKPQAHMLLLNLPTQSLTTGYYDSQSVSSMQPELINQVFC
mgnify:CR=1 FL=1